MQVLLALAEELGKFVPYVGGPAWAHVLLQPLEGLSAVEETVVREKAVQSLNDVGAELPESSISEYFCPLTKVRGFCRCEVRRLSKRASRWRSALSLLRAQIKTLAECGMWCL